MTVTDVAFRGLMDPESATAAGKASQMINASIRPDAVDP